MPRAKQPSKPTTPEPAVSRRGHPHRVGQQLIVRQAMWRILDYIERTGNLGLHREIADTLEDELVARGHDGELAAMCGATPHYNRHEGN